MKRKVATMNKISPKGIQEFGEMYHITDNVEEAQALLIRSKDLHNMEFPKELRAIARAGAGTNNIPLEVCAEKGIVVFNTPGANSNAVSELVMAMIILSTRDIWSSIDWVKKNQDDDNISKNAEEAKKSFVGGEIRGKTLGVIGLGAIGYKVANSAIGLGMNVLAYDPKMKLEVALRLTRKVETTESIDEIFAKSDYISVHVPLNKFTKKLIGEKEIDKMKDGVILLNFARDEIFDEEVVGKALESGKVAKYVVDFPNNLNTKFKNTIITSHIGGSTNESEENCARDAAIEVKRYLETGNIVNSVNYPDVSLGELEHDTRIIVLHRNKPNVITNIASMLGEGGYNIQKMASDSKGDYAAALIDVTEHVEREFMMKLMESPNILRVRVLHGQEGEDEITNGFE